MTGKRTISRRHFLGGAATLGVTALAHRLLRGAAPAAQTSMAERMSLSTPAPPGMTAGALDTSIYLPLVLRQGTGAHGPSKLGLHTIHSNNALGFVQAVHDAGAHVALVKALDEFGYLRQVKTISPETVTVARWNGLPTVDFEGDPAQKAAWMMSQHMPRWRYEADVVDYWEVLNEPSKPIIAEHVWLAQFFIEAMNIAEANGYKLAIFSYSTGVPLWHVWEAIADTGVFARAKAGGHALALHEYNWLATSYRWGEPTEDQLPYEDRAVLTGRYRYVYRDFLIPRDEVIPLVITESGLDPILWEQGQPEEWKDRYVPEMIWYDTRLREDDYVLGATMFTVGPTDTWKDYDYEELLFPGNPYGWNFLDYIVSLKDA